MPPGGGKSGHSPPCPPRGRRCPTQQSQTRGTAPHPAPRTAAFPSSVPAGPAPAPACSPLTKPAPRSHLPHLQARRLAAPHPRPSGPSASRLPRAPRRQPRLRLLAASQSASVPEERSLQGLGLRPGLRELKVKQQRPGSGGAGGRFVSVCDPRPALQTFWGFSLQSKGGSRKFDCKRINLLPVEPFWLLKSHLR